MDQTTALTAFSALSHETRLAILRLLIPKGAAGLNAGEIATKTNASASRLSFHLNIMEQAGLVTSERHSRNVIYRINYDQLGSLIRYLTNDCCGSHPKVCNFSTA